VVWQGKDSLSQGPEIYGHRISRNHGRVAADVKGSDTPGQFGTFTPAIAHDASRDEFVVLWQAKHSTTAALEIYARRLDRNGEPQGQDDIPISATGTGSAPFDAKTPDIACDPGSGDCLAVWASDAEGDGAYEIYGRILSGAGLVAGDAFQISTSGPVGDGDFVAQEPAAAWDSVNRRFLVAWSSDDSTDAEREIYARVLNADGSPLTAQARISHMGPDGDPSFDAFEPSVAFDPASGEYLLAWRGDAAGQDEQYEVYGQRLDAAGGELGATDFRISDMGPDGSSAYGVEGQPIVEYESVTSRYLVLWAGDDNTPPLVDGETEIFAQALGPDGAQIGANDVRLTHYGTDGNPNTPAGSPEVAYDPAANQSLVVYEGTGDSPLALDETEVFSIRAVDDSDGDGVVDGIDACRTVSGGAFDADADGCPDDRDADGLIDALDACAAVAGGAFDANRDG